MALSSAITYAAAIIYIITYDKKSIKNGSIVNGVLLVTTLLISLLEDHKPIILESIVNRNKIRRYLHCFLVPLNAFRNCIFIK